MIIHDTLTCQRMRTTLALCDRACLFLQSIYLRSYVLRAKRKTIHSALRRGLVVRFTCFTFYEEAFTSPCQEKTLRLDPEPCLPYIWISCVRSMPPFVKGGVGGFFQGASSQIPLGPPLSKGDSRTRMPFSVIPVETGIQEIQELLDSRSPPARGQALRE